MKFKLDKDFATEWKSYLEKPRSLDLDQKRATRLFSFCGVIPDKLKWKNTFKDYTPTASE